jgi:hypothetical protein
MAFNSSSPAAFPARAGIDANQLHGVLHLWGNTRQSAYGSNEYPATLMSALGQKQTCALH